MQTAAKNMTNCLSEGEEGISIETTGHLTTNKNINTYIHRYFTYVPVIPL